MYIFTTRAIYIFAALAILIQSLAFRVKQRKVSRARPMTEAVSVRCTRGTERRERCQTLGCWLDDFYLGNDPCSRPCYRRLHCIPRGEWAESKTSEEVNDRLVSWWRRHVESILCLPLPVSVEGLLERTRLYYVAFHDLDRWFYCAVEARESQEVLHGLFTPLDLAFGYMDVFNVASAGQQCAECSIELGGGTCCVAIAGSLLSCPPELGTLVHAFGRGCEHDSPSALWSFVPAVVSASLFSSFIVHDKFIQDG